MKPKFKQGDLVQNKDTGDYGIIISTDGDAAIVDYGWNGGCLSIGFNDLVLNEPPTSIDPTTAFLTELQNLLRKYDAEIQWRIIGQRGNIGPALKIRFGDENLDYIRTDANGDLFLTPDNIFDYEK